MTHTTNEFRLKQWLSKAFRGDTPEHIAVLADKQDKMENVMEEMLTQLTPGTRAAIARLYEIHEAETALLYKVIEELFKRHLEDHPK